MMQWLSKSPQGLFATSTLTGHLLRGAAALSLLGAALARQHDAPITAAGAALLALVLMRGCPMCWTIGLVETITQRLKARSSA